MQCRLWVGYLLMLASGLNACGGSDSDSTNSTGTATDSSTDGFPSSLAVASPTDTSTLPTTSQAILLAPRTLGSAHVYGQALTRIDSLLAGSTPIRNSFTPELFYQQDQDAGCYGPQLLYQNHPDASGMEPDDGTLPSGDLGIWTATEGSTTEACIAAQLNARLKGVRDRNLIALMSVASMIRAYIDAGNAWPTALVAGSTANIVTEMNALGVSNTAFTEATLALNTAGDTWTYHLAFTYTRTGTPYDIVVDLVHTTADDTTDYEGLLTFRIDSTLNPSGNCSTSDITQNGSLHYTKVSNTEIRLQSRSAQLCGHGSDGLSLALAQSSTSNLTSANKIVDPASAWQNNFSIFTANFDPQTLLGLYSYVWQAGPGDSHSRVMNVGIETATSGEGYFGYGDPVTTATDGSIKGFICNWAGPGNNHSLLQYAQRQHITLNSSSLVYEPTNAAASDIVYAPTVACTYDGSGSYLYDRDVDGDLSDENGLTVNVDGTSALMFDLMVPSGSASTVTEQIINRGFTQPVYP